MPRPAVANFMQPPIAEVVAAASFERLAASSLVHFGALWKEELSERFPTIQVMPPHIPPVEKFGHEAFGPRISFGPAEDFPSPRLWFLNQAGDELLQLQRDWFACNWRKVDPSTTYTRWPSRRESFMKWFEVLSNFVVQAGLGKLVPTQCEVTYINQISPGTTWKTHGEMAKIFRSLQESDLSPNLERESTRFNRDYTITADGGAPVGRLHVSAQPAITTHDRLPIYVLELTARGIPSQPDLAGIMDFLDRGRDVIIDTFAAITSDEIQEEWGRQ